MWEKIGYSRKDSAKRKLEQDLVENVDFIFHIYVENSERNPTGRPSNSIYLSLDGYKHFCMMAKTKKGREIRKYFMEVEDTYRSILESQFNSETQTTDSVSQATKDNLEISELKKLLERLDRHLMVVEAENEVQSAFISTLQTLLVVMFGFKTSHFQLLQTVSSIGRQFTIDFLQYISEQVNVKTLTENSKDLTKLLDSINAPFKKR